MVRRRSRSPCGRRDDRGGRIAGPAGAAALGTELVNAYQALPRLIDDALARFDFRAATGAICSVVQAGNRLVETQRPWELARREKQGARVAATRLDELLGVLTEACRILATELQPFIPAGASALSSQFRTHRGSIAQPTPVFARLKTPD